MQVRVGSTLSDEFVVENGIVQGSVLSPLLFSIMINDLPDNIQTSKALFADDCVIWDADLILEKAAQSIQNALDAISEWCWQWGLRISPNKSTAIIFSRKIKQPRINFKSMVPI